MSGFWFRFAMDPSPSRMPPAAHFIYQGKAFNSMEDVRLAMSTSQEAHLRNGMQAVPVSSSPSSMCTSSACRDGAPSPAASLPRSAPIAWQGNSPCRTQVHASAAPALPVSAPFHLPRTGAQPTVVCSATSSTQGVVRAGMYFASARPRFAIVAGELSYQLEVHQDRTFVLTQRVAGRNTPWMAVGRLIGVDFVFDLIKNEDMMEQAAPLPVVDTMGVCVHLHAGHDGQLKLTARFGNGFAKSVPKEKVMEPIQA